MVGINEKEFLKALKDTQKKFNSLMLANEKQMKQLQNQVKNIDSRQKEIVNSLNKISKLLQNTNYSKDLKLALKNINWSDEVGKKIQNIDMSVEFARALEKINLSDEVGRVIQNIDVSNDIRDAIKKFESIITQDREIFERQGIDEDENEDYNKSTNESTEVITDDAGITIDPIVEDEGQERDGENTTCYIFNDDEEVDQNIKSQD
jgi:hypothetical protein